MSAARSSGRAARISNQTVTRWSAVRCRRSPRSPSPSRHAHGFAVTQLQVATIPAVRHVASFGRAHAWGRPEASASRILRHSSEEIYVQVSRHARHGGLTFPGLRAKESSEMPTNRPPEAKEQSQQDHGHAQQYQHHAVAVPAPRQFEVARPTSGCRASPQQDVPSHVFGVMKFAWGSDTGGQHEVRDWKVRGKGGPYTVGSPAAGSFHGPARTPQFPSNERWSSVTLMRSSHPPLSYAAGADTTTRRSCR